MIPLKDNNPSRTFPIVNFIIIATNICIFVYPFFPGATPFHDQVLRLGFIPYELSHCVDIGPRNLVPVPLTIFTAMFMHGSWLHLVGNMLYLWIFGDNVEDRLGHFRYLFFYFMCGIIASLAHGVLSMNSTIPTIGASGAIAGVLGAYWFLFPGARINTLFVVFVFAGVLKIPAFIVIGVWVLMQFIYAFSYDSQVAGGIAWFAHIGGFVSGLFLIVFLKKQKARRFSVG